jgi:hypothetical protein
MQTVYLTLTLPFNIFIFSGEPNHAAKSFCRHTCLLRNPFGSYGAEYFTG